MAVLGMKLFRGTRAEHLNFFFGEGGLTLSALMPFSQGGIYTK